MTYITVSELKSYLGVTTTGDDALLASLIARAQSAIDTHTGRTFEAASDTTKYLDCLPPTVNGYELNWATLGLDLCQITSVTNGNGVVVTGSQYVTMPINVTPYHGLRLKQYSGVTWDYTDDWEASIAIVGRWAYSITPPADIAQACIRLAAFFYRQKDNTTDGDRPILAGDGNVIMPSTMPRDVTSILQPYVRVI